MRVYLFLIIVSRLPALLNELKKKNEKWQRVFLLV